MAPSTVSLANLNSDMQRTRFSSAAILGSGSFGMAMASLLAAKLEKISLITRDSKSAETINTSHRNPRYLSGVLLAENVVASTDLSLACQHQLIIFAVPTSATRATAELLAQNPLDNNIPLLSCAKGIEIQTGARMTEILREIFPCSPVAALSGPNHAEEIAMGLATCAVIGAHDRGLALSLQELFTLAHFRSYTSDDVAGIELGGAVKNVYALAAGIAHGLRLGDNAVAALVTRALAEMSRLGTVLGGRAETFAGLSGVGDLVATCFSPHSRNHRVGLALGQGKTLEQAVAALGMVAEGVPNTRSIREAAQRANVRTPIIDAVYAILFQGKPVSDAMQELLTRDPRAENE